MTMDLPRMHFLATSFIASLIYAQGPTVVKQTTSFNSSSSLSPAWIELVNLSSVSTAITINTAIKFDRSQRLAHAAGHCADAASKRD
ncbi:hypothetical protein F5Y05DRAFT_374713 [Hypoxylon sp. FL0543]|nr:hypothetical protein F5Y05DRAFT_374713 [Hypoxylon sp. FL0543]